MMGVLRFKAKSSYKSVLKLSALSVMVAVLSGCGKDSNNDSSSFLATIWNKNNTAQVVLTGTAIDDPIFNGTVRVMTPDGVEIGKATTKVDGTFSVSVAESFLSAPILLQVSGGTMAGQPFTGTLTAIYTSQDGRTGLNLTPVTTLVSHLANAEGGSDLAAKRNNVLNKLTALGMVDLQSWRKVTDTPFDLGTIAFRISDLGGVTPWLNTIQTDIADGELSKNEMMMGFPKAHGGVQGVNVEKYLTLIPGKQFMLTPQPDGLAEGTNWQIKLYNAPEWVSVENNIIKIAPSAAQTAGNLSFDVELIANGVAKGKKVTLELEVLAMTTLLQGQLGAAGGKIENQWKDIALEAPAGALKQTYDFTYLAGVNKKGELYRTINTLPQISQQEIEQINFLEPDAQILLSNYLNIPVRSVVDLRVSGLQRSVVKEQTTISDGVSAACSSRDVKWLDHKSYGFKFYYIWQGVDADFAFLSNGDDTLSVAEVSAPARVIEGKKAFLRTTQCASRLWSMKAEDEESVKGKEAVLFVHGFVNSGDLGGFDSNNNIESSDKEVYFGRFPDLVRHINSTTGEGAYLPFVFEWRTNARFDMVSQELAEAVDRISQKTGKKVHVVAHSFGGLLARTLIQGLTRDSNNVISPLYGSNFAQSRIATLTTVGTPHSGIFGGQGHQMDDISFPNGLDGLPGNLIPLCTAITCYQAGVNVSRGNHPPQSSLHQTDRGYIVSELAKKVNDYPNIPTQVLIGLGGTNFNDSVDANFKITCAGVNRSCNVHYTKKHGLDKQGDGLISYYGQRFLPSLKDKILLKKGALNNTPVEEHILDFDPDMGISRFDDKFNKDAPPSWMDRQGVSFINPNVDVLHLKNIGVYNHRTGLYNKIVKINVTNQGDKPVSRLQFSEVGLQNCNSATDCPHATWHYFKQFVTAHPADNIAPTTTIPVTLQPKYPTTASARAVGGAVPAGSWVRIHANGRMLAQVDLNADGSVNVPVEFVANTNYTLRIHSPGYRAKFINGEDFGATTGATVAESSLNFGIIEMETLPFAAGDMKVVVTNAVTGRPVTGYKVTAYNSVNNITGKKDEADTVANPTPTLTTLPKGYYRLEVSKDGYEIAKQMCYAKENQLTTCQINIVPKASVSVGQLLSVLRWDVNPEDLDSHLFKYDASGNRVYQIYYANPVSGADSLDVDDTDSYGPETVTINQLDPRANYVYAVHHYSGSGSITSTSQAQVSVLQNGKPVRIYKAPLTGFGRWWKVFEIKNGQVIPCQQDCMFSIAPQPTARSRALPTPRWLLDAMSVPMPPKK